MSSKLEELKLDINEFNALLKQATRQRIRNVISHEVRKLEAELAKLQEEQEGATVESSNDSTTLAKPAQNSSKKLYEVKLSNYGWDQTNTKVKIYVTLPNVQTLPEEAVQCKFTDLSLDLKVVGLDNKNHVLIINNLCEEIEPNKSGVKVKKDMIIVTLVKKEAKHWPHMTEVEKRLKKLKSSLDDTATDGDTSLMNVIKKMYQDGDDDIKRTIEKAWTESGQRQLSSDF